MKQTGAYQVTDDVVARMDAAITHACACGCGLTLEVDGPSAWFASQECQRAWLGANHAHNPGEVYRRPEADDGTIGPVESYTPGGLAADSQRRSPLPDVAHVDRRMAELRERILAEQRAEHDRGYSQWAGVRVYWEEEGVDISDYGGPIRRSVTTPPRVVVFDGDGVELGILSWS